MKRILFPTLLVLLSLYLVGCRCSPSDHEPASTGYGGFAIYLPAKHAHLDGTVEPSQIELSEDPIVSIDDIVAYSVETHEIRLVPAAADRLSQLDLPGKPFVVCIDREPIYTGEFMAAYMSRSSDGVVILWPPLGGDDLTMGIQLGYPGPDFFAGPDPRSDPRIIESLRQAGRLE